MPLVSVAQHQVTSLAPPAATRFQGVRSPEKTSEEADFEIFAAKIDRNWEWTSLDILEHAELRWKDQSKRIRFYQWNKARYMKNFQTAVPKLSPRQCLSKILETNFFNSGRRAEWHWMMEMIFKSFVVIGQATYGGVTTAYGIDPGPSYLLPHAFNPKNHGQGGFLHHSILGIDLQKAKWPGNSDPGLPPNMEIATEADVFRSRPDRFIFAQVGSLWAFQGNDKTPDNELHKDAFTKPGPWTATRFGVVVRINPQTGMPGAVYIIYNFWARGKSPEMNDFFRPSVRDDDNNILPHIGRLHSRCDPEESFIVAKIAKSIKDFIPSHDSLDFCNGTFQIDPIEAEAQVILSERLICPVREIEVGKNQYLIQHYARADSPASSA